MRDTERHWYEVFIGHLLPAPETSEHSNSVEDTDKDVEQDDLEELLNDAKGG